MIEVYGKKGCGKCEAAKDKLSRMGFDYKTIDLEDPFPSGWRSNNTTSAMAQYLVDGTLPIIAIDNEVLSYPQAMKKLKSLRRQP